ncbi:hypothetical protein MPSEU_000073600 [Mayamaea pseudoterrestris]|nr:hypothetical protein MPSEU_000073600 [Mayamaea pseudoterrestris]
MRATQMESEERHFDLTRTSPLGLEMDESKARRLDETLQPLLCAMSVSCRVLRLSVETQYTIACILIRYYSRRRMENPANKIGERHGDADNKEILGACLFLGAKVSEESRRLRDVINCIQMIDFTSSMNTDSAGNDFGGSDSLKQPSSDNGSNKQKGKIHLIWKAKPPLLDESYWDMKKKIIQLEQHVLRWIGFDTFVSSPHRAVILVVQNIFANRLSNGETSPNILTKQQQQQIVTDAWWLVNNTIFSSWCLQLPIMSLACAAVSLACRRMEQLRIAVPVEFFEVSREQLVESLTALERVERQLLSADS